MIKENEAENNIEPFSLNSKNIKKDLMLFKDEILKDLKYMQKNITDKFNNINIILKEKLESYDVKLDLYNEKISQLSNLISEDKNLKENVSKLMSSKSKFESNILTHDIKLDNIEKDYNNKINIINSILSDSVIYPNVIGGISKFKNFHDFIDYVLAHISKINTYKDKNTLDLNSYKNKIEILTERLQFQLDNIIKSSNEFTTKSVNQCEEKINNLLSLYDERFKNVRVENQSYVINLEQIYKNLKEEFKKFSNIKNSIYNKFNDEINNIRKDNFQVVKIFRNYKREFNLIKDRFTKLSEFIKDVRFRKNLGDFKRKDFMDIGNKLDFTKPQNYDISSGVKRYIDGEIKAEALSSIKKFSKTNLFAFDDEYNKNNDNLINNYLKERINFRKDFFNRPQNNSFNLTPFNTLNIQRKKSVYNLINPFSLKDYKLNSTNDEKINKFHSIISMDSISNILNNDKKTSKSNDTKLRKRYGSVMSENNIISQIQKNLDFSKLIDKDSQKSKYNNQRPIIKEENETISSFGNSSLISNSNNKKKSSNNLENDEIIIKKDIKESENKVTEKDKGKLENKEDKIEKSKEEELKIDKEKEPSANNTIKEQLIKNKTTSIILEKRNVIQNDKIKQNNLKKIDFKKDYSQKNNIEKKNTIIKNNNNEQFNTKQIEIKKYNNLQNKNQKDIVVKSDINENNNLKIVKKVQSLPNIKKYNDDIINLSLNKITIKDQILQEDKFLTVTNFKINKNKHINYNFGNFPNLEEKNKSFKGKKYTNMTKSLVMKMKENLISNELNSQKYKKLLIKPKDKINIDEENKGNKKYFPRAILSERNKEAKKIEKMVNNLSSYIFNYNNNLGEMNSKNTNNSFNIKYNLNNNNIGYYFQKNNNK